MKTTRTLVMLRVGVLNVDRSYQRGVESIADYIRESFVSEAVGALVVGRREDGTYWIVDGQQRWTAMKALGIRRCPCVVFSSRGPEHEGEVFYLLNVKSSNLKPYDKFHADRCIGERHAREVDAICTDRGFDIVKSAKAVGQISCITAVRELYELDGTGDALSIALAYCRVWADLEFEGATWQMMITAFANIAHDNHHLNGKKMLNKVLTKITPIVLRQKAGDRCIRESHQAMRTDGHVWVRLIITEMYNHKLKAGRIK